MKIAIGADHAGFEYKEEIGAFLREMNIDVQDCGTHSAERVDYPDYAVAVAHLVASHDADFGILVCGSGIGVSITANKVEGVRAANCLTGEMAHVARAHNNANVLCLGERLVSLFEAKDIVRAFLHAEFEGGRHTVRVEKIHNLTGL